MIREDMERLVADAPSISAKIRILYDAGISKADIARFVDRKYQHVRNVLLDHEKKTGRSDAGQSGPAEAPVVLQLELGGDGSLRLPQSWLDEQELGPGATVICRVDRDGLRIMSRQAAVRELAAIVKRTMPSEAALLETLLGDQTSSS